MKRKRFLSGLVALAMCVGLIGGIAPMALAATAGEFAIIAYPGEYNYDSENNLLTITSGGEYEIRGTVFSDTIKVTSDDDVTILLSGVYIDSRSSSAPFEIAGSGDVTIMLGGGNTVISNKTGALQLSSDSTLTITSENGDGETYGSLTLSSDSDASVIGSGSGSDLTGNIIINGGTITASSKYGAGIGSGKDSNVTGSITINGGDVSASSTYGAGIGGGPSGDGNNITINGGDVSASSTYGAGIGGGGIEIDETDETDSDTAGSGNNIIINGGYITLSKGTDADYIGGGKSGEASNISITGGYFADSGYTAGVYGTGMVYECDIADGYKVYANDNSETYPCFVTHFHETYDTDGFCTGCDSGYEPATLNDEGVYEISNAGQLFWFASLVSGDVTQDGITAADTTASAILTTDIDLDGKEWTPIGTKAAPYTGTFDGNGYEISGLSITTEAEYVGLFGYVENGTVKDLTVSGTIDVEGDTIFAGGIVGTIRNGVLLNLTSDVDVTGTTATKGTFGGVAATVEGTDKTAGSTMENCANYGDITASGVLDCTGGLTAYMNSATINNCVNYGAVDTTGATAQQNEGVYTAGIVSYINNATAVITNCINVGTISGAAESEDYDRYTGAIVGRIKNNVGEITNVYYLDTSADVSCAANASGVELGITAKTADELASGAVTYLLQNSASDSVWGQDLDSDVYPTLYKTNVVKLTFTDGDSTIERYANVGIVPTNYPTPATGLYAFYTDSALTNRIDTSSYTYTADATLYMAQMYTVTQNLTNVTSDNTATEVIPGSEFTANLTAADGYVIKSVTVTMGSSDITNTAYANGVVNISNVSGDIVITAIVAEKTVEINSVMVSSGSVDVDITNTLGASGTVIVAVYDAGGALVDLAAADLADGIVSVSVNTANAATVSAYIWDSTAAMTPLCDKYTTAS